MEILLAIICVLSVSMNVILLKRVNQKESTSQVFSDDEVGQIKQVLNILMWGGEDENKN
jgi:hypothetical protein